jgi:hypothetical protein
MTRTRSVRFASTVEGDVKCTYYDEIGHERCNEALWWTTSERRASKESAGHAVACAKRSNYSKVLTRILLLSLRGEKLPYSLQYEFAFELAIGYSFRGLEKYILQKIKEEREVRKARLYELIHFIQSSCGKEGVEGSHTAELIRIASESVSHKMQFIAALYGKADEFAVRFGAMESTSIDRSPPRVSYPVSSPSSSRVANAAA